MITYRKYDYLRGAQYPTIEGTCKSTDIKPTEVANGSILYEMDTTDLYMYDEAAESWVKQ